MMGWKYLKNNGLIAYILSGFLHGYVFLLFCIYPFYMENGYYNIGVAKIRFLYTLSIIVFILCCIIKILELIICKKKFLILSYYRNISITEKLVLVYMFLIIFSFLLSSFKEKILWGAEEWRMGTVPLLLMFSLALFLTHWWKEKKWIWYGSFISTAIVICLGICNRFSVYPIRIEPMEKVAFLSTLGNINWFCGYLSVISPIGIAIFLLKENKNIKHELLLIFYMLINFMIGFCQGSSSYFAWTAAMFVVMLWISINNTTRIKRYLFIVSLWAMAGQILRVIHFLFPDRYNYSKAILNGAIDTNLTLIIMVVSFLLFYQIKGGKNIPVKNQKIIRIIIAGIVVVGILVYVGLSLYNTKIGIKALQDVSILVWDENWGTGRGMHYRDTVMLFGRMSLLQKIFGVGADGFEAFAYSFPDVATHFNEVFEYSILSNAHCEILTNMINLGIMGTIVFLGIMITFALRCLKQGDRYPMLYIPGICVICYCTNNLVSFAQVLNLPFLLVIIGLGEYYLRKIESC